jgi:hypothetical protein
MHPGLAFALVALTFGLYTFYWLFETWREIKHDDGDAGKRPVGHALAVLVPVYGLFRMHAHMRTIRQRVQSYGGQTSLSAGTAVVVWIAVNVLAQAADRPSLGLLFFVAALHEAGLVAWGQAALNQAWFLKDPHARVQPTHPVKWVVLGLGGLATALALLGTAL